MHYEHFVRAEREAGEGAGLRAKGGRVGHRRPVEDVVVLHEDLRRQAARQKLAQQAFSAACRSRAFRRTR